MVFLVVFFLVMASVGTTLFSVHLNMGTMRFTGTPAAAAGFSVSGVGDVDGDKVKDFLIGAPYTQSMQGGATNAGQVYVLYGQQNTTAAMEIWGSDFNLSTLISSPLLGRVIDGAVFLVIRILECY